MTEKLDCENIVIRQFVKLQFEKFLKSRKEEDVVRMPLVVYQYCKDIFKRERIVSEYLLQLLQEVFYLLDASQLKEPKEDELAILYRKLLCQSGNHKTFYLSQIFLRCFILGLSIKTGKPELKKFRKKFRDLLTKLQLELVLEGGQILSTVVVKQLEMLRVEFEGLEYYEELGRMFEKCDVDKVTQWVQGGLEEMRKKSQAKRQSALPFSVEESTMEVEPNKKDSINYRDKKKQQNSSVSEQNQPKNRVFNKRKANKQVKSKTAGKERREVVASKESKVSCISLANKMRQSFQGPSTRYSLKYVFKSTKKNQSQEVVYQDDDETRSPSISSHINYYPTNKTLVSEERSKVEQDDNSKYLCAATPPRRNLRSGYD